MTLSPELLFLTVNVPAVYVFDLDHTLVSSPLTCAKELGKRKASHADRSCTAKRELQLQDAKCRSSSPAMVRPLCHSRRWKIEAGFETGSSWLEIAGPALTPVRIRRVLDGCCRCFCRRDPLIGYLANEPELTCRTFRRLRMFDQRQSCQNMTMVVRRARPLEDNSHNYLYFPLMDQVRIHRSARHSGL
jgi:hypothetical protein